MKIYMAANEGVLSEKKILSYTKNRMYSQFGLNEENFELVKKQREKNKDNKQHKEIKR